MNESAPTPYFGYYDKAFTIYTHVSDTYSVFSTQIITCHEREAVYVLNGILDADSSLDIKFHSTDTHGYTDILFGLMYLLGLSFQPRLADLSNVKIFFPSDFLLSEKFGEHSKIFSDKVNIDIIAEQWIELQKLKVALQGRIIPPDIMMQRLTKTVYADGLTKAVTALGRLVKSILVLKYCADPEIRHIGYYEAGVGVFQSGTDETFSDHKGPYASMAFGTIFTGEDRRLQFGAEWTTLSIHIDPGKGTFVYPTFPKLTMSTRF